MDKVKNKKILEKQGLILKMERLMEPYRTLYSEEYNKIKDL